MSMTDINTKVIEEEPCDTCGSKVEDGLAGWCGDCRDKDECRCQYCNEVRVGCGYTEYGCNVVCPECLEIDKIDNVKLMAKAMALENDDDYMDMMCEKRRRYLENKE